MKSSNNTAIIAQIQEKLVQQKHSAIVFFTGDPHISEYMADRWKIRDWVSGFRGSAGTLAVSKDNSALWTDGRYFLEAEEALRGSGITLMPEGLPDTPTLAEWLTMEHRGGSILLEADATSLKSYEALNKELKGIRLLAIADFLDDIWKDRPAMPAEAIYEISSRVCGEERQHRLKKLSAWLAEQNRDAEIRAMLITALDEIAWLLNLRGNDVAYNPVFYAYLLVSQQGAKLFTHYESIPENIRRSLKEASVELIAYADFENVLRDLISKPQLDREANPDNKGTSEKPFIMVDPANLNMNIYNILGEHIYQCESPVKLWKAKKNALEQGSIRKVMERDGIALVKTFHWIEDSVTTGRELSELEVADGLLRFRSMQEGFLGNSFTPIVGFREHGAIIHYSVSEQSSKIISGNGLLLIDSGGQYVDGTTDITRTIAIGTISAELRRQYTLVLKGHIAVATAIFPRGTNGIHIDTLARRSLWDAGLNYNHGTGHGVGFALNVHEGPQNLGSTRSTVPLEPGMLCSNEPGYYQVGSHGIRIENLVLVQPHPQFKDFLCFETVSFCPFEPDLIQMDLLSKEELKWINFYHSQVLEKLSKGLVSEQLNWLRKKTRQI